MTHILFFSLFMQVALKRLLPIKVVIVSMLAIWLVHQWGHISLIPFLCFLYIAIPVRIRWLADQ